MKDYLKSITGVGLLTCCCALAGCAVGAPELLIIFGILVLLFGASRLPQLGKALGETVKSFRSGSGAADALDEGDKAKDAVQIEEAKVEPAEDDKAS